MAERDRYREMSAKRPAAQGAVTRQLNQLRKVMQSVNPLDVTHCRNTLDKLMEAKGRYNTIHDTLLELGFLLDIDTSQLEAASDSLERDVLQACGDARGWMESMRELNQDLVDVPNTEVKQSSDVQPCKPEATKDWEELYHKLEHSHKSDTMQLRAIIDTLRAELNDVKEQVKHNQSRAVSTPARGEDRRVTFGASGLDIPRQEGPLDMSCGRHRPQNYSVGCTSRSEEDIRPQLRQYRGPPPAHSGSTTGLYPLPSVPETAVSPPPYCRDTGHTGTSMDGEAAARGVPLDLSRCTSRRSSAHYPAPPVDHPVGYHLHHSLMDRSEAQHKSLLASINSTTAKLEKFSGDPLEYTAFINAFDDLLGDTLDSSRAKLTALLAHCEGRAHRTIRWCSHKPADEGYREARRILKQKFGSPFAVSQSWLNKLLSYPVLRTPEDLESFSCDLLCCHESLEALGYSGELECTNTLRLIVAKLPIHLRNRWRRLHRRAATEDRRSLLSELITLVQDASDDVNDPAFSERAIDKVKNPYTQNSGYKGQPFGHNQRKGGSYNITGNSEAEQWLADEYSDRTDILVEVNDSAAVGPTPVMAVGGNRVTCSSCNSSTHFTAKCRKYKERSPAEKLTLVKEKNLCTLCLSSGHKLDGCVLPWRCQEKGCNDRHHTSLHKALVKSDMGSTSVAQSVNTLSIPSRLEAAEPGLPCHVITRAPFLPVTAVRIRHGNVEFETYALLDTGSTITLATERLKGMLGLIPHGKSNINLGTITDTREVSGDLVEFDVSRVEDPEFLPVDEALTVPTLPISMEHMARAEQIDKWDHLARLNLPRVSSDRVDLLIGQDNAHLLEPMGKSKGEGDDYNRKDPYGVLTPLGWTVYGAVHRGGLSASINVCQISRRSTVPVSTCATAAGEPGPTVIGSNEVDPTDEGLAMKDRLWKDYIEGESRDCGIEHGRNEEVKFGPMVPESAHSDTISEEIGELLELFWTVDSFPPASSFTTDERKVLDLWDREWKYEDGHIVVPIPYKEEPPNFPDNFVAALHSLIALGRRLKRAPRQLSQYQSAMSESFLYGFAEYVKKGDRGRPGYTNYLNHHGIESDKKPGVTRVVKSGKGKFKGVCLADKVHQGPDLMNRLDAVLTRFRQMKHGTAADIKGMFNQVKVPIDQRDTQRFLFWENGDPDGQIVVCRMTTHIFGTVWAPAACMYALRKTAEVFSEGYPEKIREEIRENFYVDDWHNSEHTEDDAISCSRGVREVVARGGFDLTKFCSSSRRVIESVPEDKRSKEVAAIDLSIDKLPVGATLGLGWDVEEDAFLYRKTPEPKPETRRGLMSCVASLYDPLGLITPFTVVAKMLLQQSCRAGCSWDEMLPPDTINQWSTWLGDMQTLAQIRIPRWLGAAPDSRNTLHHFGDSSQRAYGAASLLLVQSQTGAFVDCNLGGSRTKLAPLKTQSIPRLELCAATLCVKMETSLRETMTITLEESHFWSDSTLVLFYLLGDPATFKPFMANRVSFCQENTRKVQWHHVPGPMNPADLASRGMRAQALKDSDLWFHGPTFLRGPREQWPRNRVAERGEVDSSEIRKNKAVFSVMTTLADATVADFRDEQWGGLEVSAEQQCFLSRCSVEEIESVKDELAPTRIEQEKESDFRKVISTAGSWYKAKTRIAWLRRFAVWYQQKKGHGGMSIPVRKEPLSAADMIESEALLIKISQRWHLDSDAMKCKSMVNLSLVQYKGIWCVGGRLGLSDLPWDTKHPAVIPGKSDIARLIVLNAHHNTLHSGLDRTLMGIGGHLWVCRSRRIGRKIIRSCVKCCRMRGRPAEQKMAPLPKKRVSFNTAPFHHTGVDLFGPLHVVVRRSQEKRYGVMYSCFNTRAVHIEVALDLTSSAFLCTLERFTARRGVPESIQSDNGTNLVGARKIIQGVREVLNSDETKRAMATNHISWTTNCPSASNQGGAWERMIRVARELLMNALEGEPVTPDKLQTTLCKVEFIINSRPITKLYDSPDCLRPITPNDILQLRPPRPVFPTVFSGERYLRDYRQTQYLLGRFWDGWMRRYLPDLQRRQKWHNETREFKEGEMVILVQDQYPRFQWPIAVIREVYRGPDGLVRNVLLRTSQGELRRPVQKLIRLEGDYAESSPNG